jgi:hypothetical protein
VKLACGVLKTENEVLDCALESFAEPVLHLAPVKGKRPRAPAIGDELELAVEDREHVFDQDGGGSLGEAIAALSATHTFDDSRLFEGHEDLLEVVLGDVVSRGNVANLDRSLIAAQRELNHGCQPVDGTGGEGEQTLLLVN